MSLLLLLVTVVAHLLLSCSQCRHRQPFIIIIIIVVYQGTEHVRPEKKYEKALMSFNWIEHVERGLWMITVACVCRYMEHGLLVNPDTSSERKKENKNRIRVINTFLLYDFIFMRHVCATRTQRTNSRLPSHRTHVYHSPYYTITFVWIGFGFIFVQSYNVLGREVFSFEFASMLPVRECSFCTLSFRKLLIFIYLFFLYFAWLSLIQKNQIESNKHHPNVEVYSMRIWKLNSVQIFVCVFIYNKIRVRFIDTVFFLVCNGFFWYCIFWRLRGFILIIVQQELHSWIRSWSWVQYLMDAVGTFDQIACSGQLIPMQTGRTFALPRPIQKAEKVSIAIGMMGQINVPRSVTWSSCSRNLKQNVIWMNFGKSALIENKSGAIRTFGSRNYRTLCCGNRCRRGRCCVGKFSCGCCFCDRKT